MNKLKLFTASIMAALALVSVASAQTSIYIAGAPATRKIWNIALYNTLVAKSTGSPTITKYWSGSSYNSANQIILTGGNIGGTAVTIYASWTGSTGGNQSVAISPPQSNSALEIGFLLLSASSPGANNTNLTNLQYPDFNLSDTQQATVPFNGHVTVTSPATNYVTLNEAPTTSPAITGFKFVTNNGAPARLNNITTNLAQQLFVNGSVPLAFFTGLNTGATPDESVNIYAVGRDISSGARYILLAETGIGTANSSQLTQYEPAVSGTTITGIAGDFPAVGTINLISFPEGNGGYPSFSAVETVLAATSSNSIGYVVTYVTDSDAVTAEAAGAHELTWNGVAYGTAYEGANNTAPTSIAEGQYTYWSYLHVYYNSTWLTANKPIAQTYANDVAADLSTDTGTGAILTSDVNVSRNNDGGVVTQNY